MDPLQLLREYTMREELSQVSQVEDQIDFGDRYTFPAQSVTGYKSKQGRGDHYTLETVLFFLKNPVEVHTNYMKKAREASRGIVSMIDAADLKAYLTGEKDSSDFIDITMLAQALPVQSARAVGPEPSAKRRRGVDDADVRSAKKDAPVPEVHPLQEIYQQERELRDRNTQLVTPNKDLSNILDLLKALEKSKQSKPSSTGSQHRSAPSRGPASRHTRDAVPARPVPQASKPAVAAPLPIKPSGRFDRSDMQQAAMVKDITKLGINPYGLHQPTQASDPAARSGRAPPAAPPSRPSTQPSHTHRPPDASSSRVAHNGSGSSHNARGATAGGGGSSSREARIPIIIVSAASTAKINMLNAKSFLEDGVFKSPEECKAEGVTRQTVQTIRRTTDRKAPVVYHVTDKLPPANSRDWHRVVAVFVQGAAWQFKGFPEKGAKTGDLVETFSKYFGIYLHYHNEKVPDLVKGWKVEKMLIHRENRHNDAQLMRIFWRKLDSLLANQKSTLAY